jgi:uncharacterized membrane protein YgaE (UPF0421/DUF939 family)
MSNVQTRLVQTEVTIVRRILMLLALPFAILALFPAVASASPARDDHVFLGLARASTTVDLGSGAGNTQFAGISVPFGFFSATTDATFAQPTPTTFTSSGTGTINTRVGMINLMVSTTGTLNGSSGSGKSTDTIVGGTGRFSGASGSVTVYSKITSSSTVGSSETFSSSTLWLGNISY